MSFAIEKLFVALQKNEGSDLHISSGMPPVIRQHGTILPLKAPPLEPENVRMMLHEIMTPAAKESFENTGDADWAYELAGVARFRRQPARRRSRLRC